MKLPEITGLYPLFSSSFDYEMTENALISQSRISISIILCEYKFAVAISSLDFIFCVSINLLLQLRISISYFVWV